MYNFRTDLALERREIYNKANKLEKDIQGIQANEKDINDKIKITTVKILDEEGEQALGKLKGDYVTIDIKKLNIANEEEIIQASDVLKEQLKIMVEKNIDMKSHVLVVGLGNEYITPDSLGPKVVSNIEVTRHVIKYMPEYVDDSVRPISAISPGVLGTTGIETLEIIKGIVDNIKPDLLIVIDALASRSIDRISSSIQLSDTGIVPGAGVGNERKELSIRTLGIPVIAIGVPTVVEAAIIAADSLDLYIKKIEDESKKVVENNEEMKNVTEFFYELKEENKYDLIKDVLPEENNLIVTPKEIDQLILNMSDIISYGINNSI